MSIVLSGVWSDNFKLRELHTIMRQRDDIPFATMLNNIRTGKHSKTDVDTLKSRINYGEDYPMSALHIFSTRARVQKHNEMMLNSLDQSTHKIIQAIIMLGTLMLRMDSSAVQQE